MTKKAKPCLSQTQQFNSIFFQTNRPMPDHSKTKIGALPYASVLLATGAALLIHTLAPQAKAQAIDTFDRTDWAGEAGDGWSGGWASRGNPHSTNDRPSAAIVPPASLWQNHSLKVTPPERTETTGINVSRTFQDNGALNVLQPYQVSFQMSIDSFGTFQSTETNHFFLAQGSATASFNATSSTNWFIAGFGGTNTSQKVATSGDFKDAGQAQWNILATPTFGSSAVWVPTGISLATGVIYSFEIKLDPVNKQYSISISDGTDDYDSGILYYHRNSNLQQTLIFGENFASTQGAVYSIGNLQVIPEPSTVALVGLTGAALLMAMRRAKAARHESRF